MQKTQTEIDEAMHDKGYRYKLTPLNANFLPLFTKTLAQLGPLMRDYPDTRFDVTPLRYDWKLADLFHLWTNNNHEQVVRILSEDHPALTALFLAQGIADKIIKRDDLNIVANKLSELRQAEFH
jgi:hypothetical protein